MNSWNLEENKKKNRNTQRDLVNINNVIGFLIKNADRINLNWSEIPHIYNTDLANITLLKNNAWFFSHFITR